MRKIRLNLRKEIAVAICLAGSVTLFAQETGVVINGVMWATRNVDAFGTFALTPESSGMFYQWNRPTAWAVTGSVTGWDSSTPQVQLGKLPTTQALSVGTCRQKRILTNCLMPQKLTTYGQL